MNFFKIALLSFLSLSICSSVTWSQTQPTCPVPPTLVEPSVTVEVSYDSKSHLYTYNYTVGNARSSPVDLKTFIIYSDEAPLNQKGPTHWLPDFIDLPETPKHILWGTVLNRLKPGQSLKGFSLQSVRAPGPLKYFVRAKSEVPTVVPTDDDDEPTPNCPGFFFDAKPLEGDVVGVTQGPMPPGQIAAKIRIHREEGDAEERIHKLDGDDQGFVFVTLLGSNQLNIANVDTSTVVFGPAGAKPISTKIIGPGESNKPSVNAKKLIMKFNIKDLGLRCNIDRALFVSGKVSGSTFFGGAEVKPSICQPKPQPPRELKKSKKKVGL